jgi:hypothetical protein
MIAFISARGEAGRADNAMDDLLKRDTSSKVTKKSIWANRGETVTLDREGSNISQQLAMKELLKHWFLYRQYMELERAW